MKVNDPRSPFSTPVDRVSADQARPVAKQARPVDSDGVKLSGDLRLADEAIRAAMRMSDVRPERVREARALLESGALGNDLEQLADRLIDSLDEL